MIINPNQNMLSGISLSHPPKLLVESPLAGHTMLFVLDSSTVQTNLAVGDVYGVGGEKEKEATALVNREVLDKVFEATVATAIRILQVQPKFRVKAMLTLTNPSFKVYFNDKSRQGVKFTQDNLYCATRRDVQLWLNRLNYISSNNFLNLVETSLTACYALPYRIETTAMTPCQKGIDDIKGI